MELASEGSVIRGPTSSCFWESSHFKICLNMPENLVSHSEEHPGDQDLCSEGIQKQENVYGYRNV